MAETDNIEEIYKKELFNGEPIVYKDVKLYPVKCDKLIDFYSCIQVLLYDPLRYPTEVSALPRLYFLTDIINHQNDENYIMQNPMLLTLFIQMQYLLTSRSLIRFEVIAKPNQYHHGHFLLHLSLPSCLPESPEMAPSYRLPTLPQ